MQIYNKYKINNKIKLQYKYISIIKQARDLLT